MKDFFDANIIPQLEAFNVNKVIFFGINHENLINNILNQKRKRECLNGE